VSVGIVACRLPRHALHRGLGNRFLSVTAELPEGADVA